MSGEETLYAVGGTVDDRRGSVEAATCGSGSVGEPTTSDDRSARTEATSAESAGTEPAATTASEETTTPGQPGFTIGAGVLGALASAAMLAARRGDP